MRIVKSQQKMRVYRHSDSHSKPVSPSANAAQSNDLLGLQMALASLSITCAQAVELRLADRRLRVLAAPGSGKTTLGLEVFRRLGRPAIVPSPTRTILNQWIERLKNFISDRAS